MAYNTSGSYNTSLGNKALHFNQGGWYNTALGSDALASNRFSNNTAVGYQALLGNTTGNRNTAVGSVAGTGNQSGNYNTIIGAFANTADTSYINSVALGDAVIVTASNQVRIGDAGVSSIGGYANWTNISDGRFKRNVRAHVPGLDFILLLEPVMYNLDLEAINDFLGVDHSGKVGAYALSGKREMMFSGFVAQDVAAAARSVDYEFSGIDAPDNEKDTYGLRYAEFVVPLVKAVQEQQELIEMLKKEVEALREEVRGR
jgi:hypothetical protein